MFSPPRSETRRRQNKSLLSSSSVTLSLSVAVSPSVQSELWSISPTPSLSVSLSPPPSLSPSLSLPSSFPSALLSPSVLHPPTHFYDIKNKGDGKKREHNWASVKRAELTSERQSLLFSNYYCDIHSSQLCCSQYPQTRSDTHSILGKQLHCRCFPGLLGLSDWEKNKTKDWSLGCKLFFFLFVCLFCIPVIIQDTTRRYTKQLITQAYICKNKLWLQVYWESTVSPQEHPGNVEPTGNYSSFQLVLMTNTFQTLSHLPPRLIKNIILLQSTSIKLSVALVCFKAALLASLLSACVHSSDDHPVLLATAIAPTSGSLDCRWSRETSESIACFQSRQRRYESSLAPWAISPVSCLVALQALTTMEMRLLSSAL